MRICGPSEGKGSTNDPPDFNPVSSEPEEVNPLSSPEDLPEGEGGTSANMPASSLTFPVRLGKSLRVWSLAACTGLPLAGRCVGVEGRGLFERGVEPADPGKLVALVTRFLLGGEGGSLWGLEASALSVGTITQSESDSGTAFLEPDSRSGESDFDFAVSDSITTVRSSSSCTVSTDVSGSKVSVSSLSLVPGCPCSAKLP